MSQNLPLDPGAASQEPRIRAFQLDASAFGNLNDSVNRFRGDLNLPMKLVQLTGRNGLDIVVSAFYGSNVREEALTWNATAPTSVLGLGWSIPPTRIFVDDKNAGNDLAGDYFLQYGGAVHALIRVGEDAAGITCQCRDFPLWKIRYRRAGEVWTVVREDGMSDVYGDAALPESGGTLMYGVKWGNWIGAGTSDRPEPSRFVMGWNLARSASPWGDTLIYRYQNDQPEVVAGLRYTRSSDLLEIVDMLGQSVRFEYVPKKPFEYVPPHQTADGRPDPLYQDRYDVNALAALTVRAGGDRRDVLYQLTFSYRFVNLAGSADEIFTKRLLTAIIQTRGGGEELPPVRFEYDESKTAPNPGALSRLTLPEGGVITVEYADKVLNRSDLAAAARADLATDIFDKNITVPSPDPAKPYRPFVWQGFDYLVIGWYTETASSRLDVTIYQFGGRWSEPWKQACSIAGRIDVAQVRVALGADFFGLYLPDTNAGIKPAVHIFRKTRDQFGRWQDFDVSADLESQISIPAETSLSAGERVLVLHAGGSRRIHRWSFDQVAEVWVHAEHSAPNNTARMSVAARDNYYVASYYDDGSRRASFQLFFRDAADRWQIGAVSAASTSAFDWLPIYGSRFWSLGATFAAGTFLPAGKSAAVLRTLWWDETFRVLGDKELDGAVGGVFLETAAIGSLLANGNFLHRFNGFNWDSASFAATPETLYAYGEDLALISRVSGGGAETTLAQYDPNAGAWHAEILPRDTTVRAVADAALAAPAQVFPPTVSADCFTAEDRLYRLLPDARWVRLPETLPVDSTKLSLENRAPGYLVFEDQVSDPRQRKAIAWLLDNGEVVGRKEYPGERIYTGDDPASAAALLAGYRAFVTYPADRDINAVDRIFLHRVLNHSLDDLQTDAVVETVRQELGNQTLLARYDYAGDTAVFDTSGQVVQYPSVVQTNGTGSDPSAAGSSVYEFYNGLADQVAGDAGLEAHYSLLAGFLHRSAEQDAAGIELSGDETTWQAVELQHGPESPVGVLLAAAQIKEGSKASTLSGLAGGARVVKRTDFTYDPATAMQVSATLRNDDASGNAQELRRELLHAWRVPAYAGMKEARMLSQVAQETLSNSTAATGISSTATTYRNQWPGGAGAVWDKLESWTWRGETKTPGTFDFSGAGDRSGWLLEDRIDRRGTHGKPLLLTDVDGVQTSLLYDLTGWYQVAMFRNADAGAAPSQASYYGFESYETSQGWTRLDGGALPAVWFDDTVSYAGLRSLRVPGDGGGIEARFGIPASKGRVVLSCWVRTLPGFPAGQAAWTVTAGGAAHELPVPDTGGAWRYLFLYADLGGIGTAPVDVICRLRNGAAGTSLWLDDLRVAPVDGDFAARVYEPATFMPLALLDQNTAAARQVYDDFLRPLAVVGASGQLLQIKSRSLSRMGNGGQYNQDDPNSDLLIVPAEGGFHENLRGGDWQERWTSPAPSHWAGVDGGIRHVGSTRDVLALKDSADAADSGIRLAVTPPAGGKIDQPLGLQVGDGLTVQWVPAGEWQMLGAGGAKVAAFAEPAFVAGSWLLLAGRHGVMFYRNGQLILSHTFEDEIAGELRLFTQTDGLLFRQILVFFAPQATTSYNNGIGQDFQQQTLADDGTIASATLYDGANRPAIRTKARPYAGANFRYQPKLVTGFDPVSGRMTGELADYYGGQDGRSNDEGYPYTRQLYASCRLERLLETGQAGRTLAITDGLEQHTNRLTYAANRAGAFPGKLPATRYGILITTDPQGNRREVTTDLTGRTVASQSFGAGSDQPLRQASFAYDERGLLSRIFPPSYYQPPAPGTADGFVIELRYDGLGRQVSQRSSDTGETETIYDDAGRVRFILPADGRSADPPNQPNRIQYKQYDLLGRLLATGWAEALWNDALRLAARDPLWLPPGAEWQTRNVYDGDGTEPWALGQMTRTEARLTAGGPFTQEMAYDITGNLRRVTEQVQGDGGYAAATEYRYGPSGQLLEIRYPQMKGAGAASLVVTRAYDKQGQLSTVGQPGLADAFAAYTYNALGDVATETLNPRGTAITTRYEYNSPGALRHIDSSAFRQSLAYFEQPGYGGTTYYNGVIARIDQSFGHPGMAAPPAPLDITWLYAYDGLSQLTTARNVQTPGDSLGVEPDPVRFDADGNILRFGIGADGGRLRTYEYYAGTNRLRNADAPGTDAYGYDRDGNVLSTPDADHAALSVNFVTGLTEQVVNRRTAETQEITYGVADQRTRVQRLTGGGAVAGERHYFHGGLTGGPLAEMRAEGGTAQELAYVYGPSGLIALVARDAGGSGETRGFVVRDHLRSSRMLLDAAGNLLGGYDYGPFGAALAPPAGSRPELLSFRFTGQEWDAGVALYNFKARLYDPAVQRFLSPDPARESYSPYLYVENNPLSNVDPTGAFSIGGFFASLGEVAAGIALVPFTGGASLVLTGVGITGIIYSARTGDSNFSWGQWAQVEGATAISSAEVWIGVGLQALGEFPTAAALGATFIGAGVSGYMYTVTNTQDFDWKQYGISMGIGAATGLLTGGFGELGAAVAAQATSDLGKAAIATGFTAAGGATSGYVGQGFKNVAAGQSWKDAFTNVNAAQAALLQGAVGALAGAVAFSAAKVVTERGFMKIPAGQERQQPRWSLMYLKPMWQYKDPGLRALVGVTRVTAPAIFNTSSQITAHTLFRAG